MALAVLVTLILSRKYFLIFSDCKEEVQIHRLLFQLQSQQVNRLQAKEGRWDW